MTLNDWFAKGMTWDEYVASMSTNRERMMGIYEQVKLEREEEEFFRQGADLDWRVIVLTADWCGDAMLCLPIFRKIAEAARFEMSFLIRDENLELMDQYLTNGTSRSIPIFILIDREGRERAVWGPRAPEVQALVDEVRATLPPKDDPKFAEKQKEVYRGLKDRFCTDRRLWQFVKDDVRRKLEAAWQKQNG
ncbi:thioredoxin family protein [Staphylospora marina]|uniref:thioredoxin family protein n=1 Tax=Staphylospora marina TaxID=2490858 RepID=UPI000F5BAA54|nr:thioredoxin family protein [Staphylospora marina]